MRPLPQGFIGYMNPHLMRKSMLDVTQKAITTLVALSNKCVCECRSWHPPFVCMQGRRNQSSKGRSPPQQISAYQLTLLKPGGRLCPPHQYSPLPPWISKPSNSPGMPWFFSFLVFAFAFLKKFHHFKTLTKIQFLKKDNSKEKK